MAREDKWDKTLQTKYMRQAQEQMRAIVSLFAFWEILQETIVSSFAFFLQLAVIFIYIVEV